jgi:prophage DNA circulation protein
LKPAIRKDAQKKNLAPEDANYLIKRFKDGAVSSDGTIGFNILLRIETDWERSGQKEVDLGPTRDALDEALKGREAEFEQWVQGMILAEAGEPKLTIGRKKVQFTLENIVDYMTSSSEKGVESTMTFGEGKARAMSAAKISDIEEMRNRAQSEIGTKEEVNAVRNKTSKLLEDYRLKVVDHYGSTEARSVRLIVR